MTAPRVWFREHGRPYGPGAAGVPLILAPTTTVAEALWTLEQALRSGAVALALGAVDGASLAQTRRLDFAARQGEAAGLVLPRRLDGLSAARRRWRISIVASATDLDDPRAPGPARLVAELVRGRGERPGAWMLEQDDETHRLRLADRLAGDGLAAIGHAGAAFDTALHGADLVSAEIMAAPFQAIQHGFQPITADHLCVLCRHVRLFRPWHVIAMVDNRSTHCRNRQNRIDTAGGNGRGRHAVVAGLLRILHDHIAAGVMHRAQAFAAVTAIAGQQHHDDPEIGFLGQ